MRLRGAVTCAGRAAHNCTAAMEATDTVLPATVYRSSGDEDAKTCALAICGCCGLVPVALAMIVAPSCFGISGIVFLTEEYNTIPDCAHPYKAWCIVMTVLFACTLNQSRSTDFEAMMKLVLVDMSGCASLTFALILSIPALVGYFKVVHKIEDGCNLDGMHKLYVWTWFVLGYYAVLSGIMLLGALLRCFDARRVI